MGAGGNRVDQKSAYCKFNNNSAGAIISELLEKYDYKNHNQEFIKDNYVMEVDEEITGKFDWETKRLKSRQSGKMVNDKIRNFLETKCDYYSKKDNYGRYHKVNENSIIMREYIFYMPKEEGDRFRQDEKLYHAWCDKNLDWFKRQFPNAHIIAAVGHYKTETTPHMQIAFIPLDEKGKLSNNKDFYDFYEVEEEFNGKKRKVKKQAHTGRKKQSNREQSYINEVLHEFGIEGGVKGTDKKHGDLRHYNTILEKDNSKLRKENDEVKDENTKLKEANALLQKENEELSAKRKRQQNDIANKNDIQTKQHKNIASNDKKLREQESKLSSLKDKIQSLESYSKSIIDMATLEANHVIEEAKEKGKKLIDSAKEKVASMLKLGEAQKDKLIKDGEAYFDNFIEEGENEYRQIISKARQEAKQLEDDAKKDADKILADANKKKEELEKLDNFIKRDEKYYNDLKENISNFENTLNQMKKDIKSNNALQEKIEYERVKAELSFYKEKDRINSINFEIADEIIEEYYDTLQEDMREKYQKNFDAFCVAMNGIYKEYGLKLPYPEYEEVQVGNDGPSR